MVAVLRPLSKIQLGEPSMLSPQPQHQHGPTRALVVVTEIFAWSGGLSGGGGCGFAPALGAEGGGRLQAGRTKTTRQWSRCSSSICPGTAQPPTAQAETEAEAMGEGAAAFPAQARRGTLGAPCPAPASQGGAKGRGQASLA